MFLLCIYIFATIFGLMLEGKSGLGGTVLAAEMDTRTTAAFVEPTTDFVEPASGFSRILVIEDETLQYTGVIKNDEDKIIAFTGLIRGISDTTAAEHKTGKFVFDEAPGFLNRMVATQEHDVECTGLAIACWVKGKFSLVGVGASWISAIPKIIKSDYAYLDGNMVYIRYMLWIFGAGLVLDFARIIWGR